MFQYLNKAKLKKIIIWILVLLIYSTFLGFIIIRKQDIKDNIEAFYLDGNKYTKMEEIWDYNVKPSDMDIKYVDSIKSSVDYFYKFNRLKIEENNLVSCRIPAGSKIYATDYFNGDVEYRLLIEVDETFYICYPLNSINTYEKYFK